MAKDIKKTKKGKMMVKGKNRYIRFDWAAKYMLRSKADFAIFEGLINVLIGEKIEIKEQIRTAITSNRTQFLAMMIVPVGIVLMLRLMSSSFAESFSTPGGIIANTVAIVIFIISYFMGMKILNVRV